MIQRLQSVFLLLSGLVLGLLFNSFWSFASIDSSIPPELEGTMMADGVYTPEDHTGLIILVLLGMVIPLLTVFLFKNRPLQIRLSKLSMALIAILIILTAVLFYSERPNLPPGIEIRAFQVGYLIPLISIAFLSLAIKFIKKDEKLVRSADRLR